jgi:hypothetical protein
MYSNFLYFRFRSPSEHSGRKGCCGQFFQSPKSLGLIAMIALGGVACALGGAAWGASGLVGQPSTHLTVSLLMIGKRQIVYIKANIKANGEGKDDGEYFSDQ